MGMQEEKTARSIPSESRSQAAQPTHATPIRHRGASSATMSNSTISKIKFADQPGASGRDNAGTLPFMALDLLVGEGLRGEVPRRYLHEAESFAWSLVYLYLTTVECKDGNNYTKVPYLLHWWFADWEGSRTARFARRWHDHDITGAPLAHPNVRWLARALHRYWVDRYTRRFQYPSERNCHPSVLVKIFNIEDSTTEDPPYEELDDDRVFQEILVKHEGTLIKDDALDKDEDPLYTEPLQKVWDYLVEMGFKYKEIDWDA